MASSNCTDWIFHHRIEISHSTRIEASLWRRYPDRTWFREIFPSPSRTEDAYGTASGGSVSGHRWRGEAADGITFHRLECRALRAPEHPRRGALRKGTLSNASPYRSRSMGGKAMSSGTCRKNCFWRVKCENGQVRYVHTATAILILYESLFSESRYALVLKLAMVHCEKMTAVLSNS